MGLKEQISEDMKAAMIAKNSERLGALRLIKAELLKAEKEKGLALDSTREMAVLQSMLKQRRDSIEQFEAAGRTEMAAQERSEAEVIQSFLPQSLSEEEMNAIIDQVLAEAGTPDPKQLGKLMGQIMGKLKATGKPFDGKAANEAVKSRLDA